MAALNPYQVACPQENLLPYLHDDATIHYINESHVLFMMRGVPGSGKSTLAQGIARTYNNVQICSADDFHMKDGVYMYDPNKKGEAHQQCHDKAQEACETLCNTVIIDNTNILRWEMSFYFQLAMRTGYAVVLVRPNTPWMHDADMLAKRNKHEVPREAIIQKISSFQAVAPLYYGWFVNQTFSERLIDTTQSLYKQCWGEIDEFGDRLTAKVVNSAHDPVVEYDNLDMDMYNFYNGTGVNRKCVHCTAYFCRRGKHPAHDVYSEKVKLCMGKVYSLLVTGIVLTSRTVCARLQLTDDQLKLWMQEERETKLSECQDSVDGVHTDLPAVNFQPGCYAHLTLAHTSHCNPVQAGLDLLDIIKLEKNAASTASPVSQLDEGNVYDFGDGQYVIELKEPVIVDSLFTGYY